MLVPSLKGSVITNALMESNDIWLSISWACRFLLTPLLPMCRTIKAEIEMVSHNLDYFRAKPVNIPKVTILLDHGYHPDKLTAALKAIYPQVMTKIRFQLAPKPTPAQKAALGKVGFVPIATRVGN